MNIHYLSDSIVPTRTANSVHVMKMCSAFSELGNNTVLYTINTISAINHIDDYYEYYNVDNNFSLIKHPLVPIPTRFSKHLYPYIVSSISKFKDIDMAYCRDLTSCYLCSKIKIPSVFEAHLSISDYGEYNSKKIRHIVNSPYVKNIVLISEELSKIYLKEYPELKDKIIVAHDGADAIKTRQTIDRITKSKMFNAGYTGSLHEGRGIKLIVDLAKRMDFVHFHIIGGNKKNLTSWRNRTNDLNNITFYGFKSPLELEKYLNSFDLLLAPYQKTVYIGSGKDTSKYMSPIKIFEYMSAKKPIICSNHKVLQEVFEDQINSLLVEPDDLEAWDEAIKKLYNDRKLRLAIANRAYDDFINKYTWKKRAQYILNNIEL